ncbi:MAG: hypothetical protein AVDCRST_MAG83-527, partial [uncultured Arthrobacter sp.]
CSSKSSNPACLPGASSWTYRLSGERRCSCTGSWTGRPATLMLSTRTLPSWTRWYRRWPMI